jgi:hypothetical protein
MKDIKFKKLIPIFFYLILIVYIFQFRYKLDKFGPYFTSDGAIKIFQTVQYRENGLLSLECLYPGKKYDPDFKFYPISYPWAIFSERKNAEKCVLEYPPFFYWLGSLLLYFLPIGIILYVPILFYSLSIFLFDKILRSVGLESLFRVFIVVLSFFSFPLLTSLDYTESAFFIFIYLMGFDCLVSALKSKENSKYKHFIQAGFFIGLAFVFRLEILIPFGFLTLSYFLLYKNFRNSFLLGAGFLFIVSFFLLYNYYVSGHILGFRYVSSIDLNENSQAAFSSRLHLLKAYLWGDRVMVGILQFNPLCYFMVFIWSMALLKRKLSKEANLFLLAGLFSIISIPFYVTFYGGVGYFGLRYLEAPFFLIVIGFSYYFSRSETLHRKWSRVIVFIILGFIFYFNLLTTREGLKVLRSSSADLSTLHREFNKSNRFVIHTSLYSSIWMGNSFLNKIHVLAYNTNLFNEYLKNIEKDEIFVIIQSPKEIYISSDIPKKFYERYQTSVAIDLSKIKIIEENKMFGVRRILAKKI